MAVPFVGQANIVEPHVGNDPLLGSRTLENDSDFPALFGAPV
jgi:hypothetical protein